MTKILDDREVEYAYADRIVIYPNQKVQKEVVIPEDATAEEIQELTSAEPEFEYVTKITNTYDLKDADKRHLTFEKVNHTLPATEKELDTTEIETLIGTTLKTKIAADKLELSGFDILAVVSK